MDGRTDGRTDGPTDRPTDRHGKVKSRVSATKDENIDVFLSFFLWAEVYITFEFIFSVVYFHYLISTLNLCNLVPCKSISAAF